MGTSVTLTGTGVPHPSPGRAGPGALVRVDDIALQFDAGRGTVLRLMEAGLEQAHLAAVFVTHVHSDHVMDLADVAMTRWILQQLVATGPLDIVVPRGAPERFVQRMLEPFADDIAVRMAHGQPGPPEIRVYSFDVPETATLVWSSSDGSVVVDAIGVHHEPVAEAVAYRITSPSGVIVISGDTKACREVEELSRGVDLLVHEACRATALRDLIVGTRIKAIFSYHADAVELGSLATRAEVRHLVLTHLIPAPNGPEEEQGFVDDVRSGGFTGQVTVGRDLMCFDLDMASDELR
jgi:ribonuclease Z